MKQQAKPYPFRFTPQSMRDEVQEEADKNFRSLNAEMNVLISEALRARRESRDEGKACPK